MFDQADAFAIRRVNHLDPKSAKVTKDLDRHHPDLSG
jgi:hypothetical protein